MKNLYRFMWDCGRMGEVESLFIAEDVTVAKAIGKEVYFGEILGKHSEVFGSLDKDDIEIIDSNQEFIDKLESILGSSISGYNPLDYMDGN